ncbi:DUF1707 domain-containing protein [Kutzneria viridogrisea]|uniref:DUF1707 domain-containing protein n=1 Tax=Kutzneria viridogrisea TaxID=47990 RepID=A0ABR6BY64_9PSEU|nr:hypothetical protein [Kutzneria viridogrisea]
MDQPVPQENMRVSDADRKRVAKQVEVAHAEGRLNLAEFDERTAQIWAARTYGELALLTADLPDVSVVRPPVVQVQHPAPTPPPAQPPARRSRRGRVVRAAVGAWLTVSVLNVVIWGMVQLTTLHWVYPWWIWVAGPWGALLVMGWLLGWGRSDRD